MIGTSKKALVIILAFLPVLVFYRLISEKTDSTLQKVLMSCQLAADPENGCFPVPVLEKGTLELFASGQFELKGLYNACFLTEDRVISGSYQSSSVNDTLSMELLARHIQGMNRNEETLPKTIGTVRLNRLTLKGLFSDIWAPSRDLASQLEKVPTLNILCQKK